jgi:peroxiredoxin/outer membrane lipoprotein-sorting protein
LSSSLVCSALFLVPALAGARPAPDPVATAKAETLLRAADRALAEAPSLRARYTQIDEYGQRFKDLRQTGSVVLARPGELRIEITRARRVGPSDPWRDTGNNTLRVSDGRDQFSVFFHPNSTQVRKLHTDKEPAINEAPILSGFFSGKGTPAHVLAAAETEGDLDSVQVDGGSVRYRIGTIDREVDLGDDGLVHRLVVKDEQTRETRTWTLDSVTLGAVTSASDFRYAPPKDALPYDAGRRKQALGAGSAAPDFSVADTSGKTFHLSELRGKVVVLKFWATWCWPCNQSLPDTESLAERHGSQDVEVVAVAIKDSRKGLDAWLKKHRQYSHIRFAFEDPNDPRISGAYQVWTQPTVYVIGRDGTIRGEFEGFTGPNPALEQAVTDAVRGP